MTDMFKQVIADKQRLRGIRRQQRYVGRPSLEKLFEMNDSKTGRIGVFTKHTRNTITLLKEIGDHLNVHYSTVSKVISPTAKG